MSELKLYLSVLDIIEFTQSPNSMDNLMFIYP